MPNNEGKLLQNIEKAKIVLKRNTKGRAIPENVVKDTGISSNRINKIVDTDPDISHMLEKV